LRDFEGKPMNAGDAALLPGDRSAAVKLAILGMISGGLSWALVELTDQLNLKFDYEASGLLLVPVGVYPGLVFGVIFGALFHLRAGISRSRAIGYVLAAGLGYIAAFHVAFYIIANVSSHDATPAYIVGGIPAGFVGSLLLGLLTKLLLQHPNRLVLRVPVITGTVAGALLGLGSIDDHNGWGFLAFFILWQGAYGAALAPLLRASGGASGLSISGS
jgi:hypothetical protein